jgi:hypothetical protein
MTSIAKAERSSWIKRREASRYYTTRHRKHNTLSSEVWWHWDTFSSELLLFFPRPYHSTVALHTHVSSGEWILLAAVQRLSLAPSTWSWATLQVQKRFRFVLLHTAFANLLTEFYSFIVQVTWGWRTDQTAVYIITDGMGKILTNTFETDYFRWYSYIAVWVTVFASTCQGGLGFVGEILPVPRGGFFRQQCHP